MTGPHDWIEAEEKADVADVPFPPREPARLVTGPLAPLFAQVREESALLADWAEEPVGMKNVDVDNVRGRLLAALSVIERHVQDMETALRDAEDELRKYATGSPLIGLRHRIRDALAALPAREKGTE